MCGVSGWSSFLVFACSFHISQHHLLKSYFCSILCSCSLCQILNYHRKWVYFWALYSVPLVYVSVLRLVAGCFDYSVLVIQLDIRYCDPSYFSFSKLQQLFRVIYGSIYLEPYFSSVCSICEICHWNFNRDCGESIPQSLDSMAILIMLILPIHEHGTCFHLSLP